MALSKKDVETIESIIYKNADDTAVSIARTFERFEERLDALESRVSARIADVEDRLVGIRQNIEDRISEVRADIRERWPDAEA